MVDLGHAVCLVDVVRIGVVTDLGDGGAQLPERDGLRKDECLVDKPGGAERRIEVGVVSVLVGIDEGGTPVVTAGDLEEELLPPGGGELAHCGEHGLRTADASRSVNGVAGVADVVLQRDDQTTVGGSRSREVVVVVVLTDKRAQHRASVWQDKNAPQWGSAK